MDTPRPPGQTMAATDSSERGMSLTQQPTPTPLDPTPKRSRGERLGIALAAVVTLLALAGTGYVLTNDDEAPPRPAPAPSVAAPSAAAPSAQPAPPTANDLAATEAQERYREYLRVEDEVGASAYRNFTPFTTVAVVPELGLRRLAFEKFQAVGARQVGTGELASLVTTSVNLLPQPGAYPEVVLKSCLNVSGIDVIDATGKSLVTSAREPRSNTSVTMLQYEPGTKGAERGGWYVYEIKSIAAPC